MPSRQACPRRPFPRRSPSSTATAPVACLRTCSRPSETSSAPTLTSVWTSLAASSSTPTGPDTAVVFHPEPTTCKRQIVLNRGIPRSSQLRPGRFTFVHFVIKSSPASPYDLRPVDFVSPPAPLFHPSFNLLTRGFALW